MVGLRYLNSFGIGNDFIEQFCNAAQHMLGEHDIRFLLRQRTAWICLPDIFVPDRAANIFAVKIYAFNFRSVLQCCIQQPFAESRPSELISHLVDVYAILLIAAFDCFLHGGICCQSGFTHSVFKARIPDGNSKLLGICMLSISVFISASSRT